MTENGSKSEIEIADIVKGRHIATVKAVREEGALRVDLGLIEGGTLVIRLSQDPPNYKSPNFSTWRVGLRRGGKEVRMRWVDPEGSRYPCCDGRSDNEEALACQLRNREVVGIERHDGLLRLVLDKGAWCRRRFDSPVTPPG